MKKLSITIMLSLVVAMLSCFGGDDGGSNLSQEDAAKVYSVMDSVTDDAGIEHEPTAAGADSSSGELVGGHPGITVSYNYDVYGANLCINDYSMTVTFTNYYDSTNKITINGNCSMEMSGCLDLVDASNPFTMTMKGNLTVSGAISGSTSWEMTITDDGNQMCITGHFNGMSYTELMGGASCF